MLTCHPSYLSQLHETRLCFVRRCVIKFGDSDAHMPVLACRGNAVILMVIGTVIVVMLMANGVHTQCFKLGLKFKGRIALSRTETTQLYGAGKQRVQVKFYQDNVIMLLLNYVEKGGIYFSTSLLMFDLFGDIKAHCQMW